MATTGGSFDREKLLERLCGGKFDQASAGESEAQVESIVEATKQVLRHVSGSVKPPLYALIIGINDYETIPPLAAAAPDAIEFKKFLTDDLLVPEEQITLLLNKEATRDGIIKAFQNVANDKRIQKDDPIVIYYAGHGSEINPPPDRAENGPQVQCIIPQNISKATGVVAIPDFTVGALLTQIANAKGDNITVIFDCCHSAGGSRDFEGSRFVDKSLLPELPRNPDAAVIKTATEGTRALIEEPDGFLTAGMASHVLLAACSHAEVAFENGREGHGYFSMALLKLLRSIKVDNITYKGCMQRLPALRTRQPQNPVCEGKNIDRIFFNAKVPGANSQFIAVKLEGIRKTPFLQAGLAQGVTPGCTFAIHSDCVIGPNNPVLGSLVVAESEPFRSLLKPLDGAAKFTIPAVAYGRQTGYGEDQALDVHITEGFVNAAEQDPKWGRAFSGGQSNVVLRPCTEDLAQLVVGISPEGEAMFTTSNPTAIAYGIQELPFTVPPTADAVVPVLRAAARWNYHLRRMPGSRPFQKSVQMEFYKLDRGTEFDAQGNPILKPVGENLNQGGEADIVLGDGSKKDPYGFKITNTSSRDLYAYLFFFSIPDQAIIPKFNRTIGPTKVDPSLPQNVPLTLGYGSGGERPLMFKLDPGVDLDCGIFKMFVTTDWADFDSLKQTSPFEGTRADVSDEEVEDQLGKQPLWDVITMNLVQRRYPKPAEQPKPVPEPVRVEEAPQPQESAKPDEPAPAEGQGQTVFTGKSENPASVQSYGPNPNTLSWFRSPVLTKSLLDSITNMRLRTLSREQAPAGNNAEGAWFDLYVIDSEGIPKVSPDYQPLAFKSHQSPRGANSVWTDGTVFDRQHAIWKQVEVGDCFEVVVNAKGRGWSNIADEGSLIFW